MPQSDRMNTTPYLRAGGSVRERVATLNGSAPDAPVEPVATAKSAPRKMGFTQVFPAPELGKGQHESEIDVIAIHGLATQSPGTWLFENRKDPKFKPVHWLRDPNMLPDKIPSARIFTYDWNANLDDDAACDGMLGHADQMLAQMVIRGLGGSKKRPIIFIASCFGGLVLIKALQRASQAHSEYGSILESTVGVVFLGTPFQGSDDGFFTAQDLRVASALATHGAGADGLVKFLSRNEKELDNIVQLFTEIVNVEQFKFPITCFYENRTTDLGEKLKQYPPRQIDFNSETECLSQIVVQLSQKFKQSIESKPKRLIVDQKSACLSGHKRLGLDVTHTMMNKYATPDDTSFELVSYHISKMAKDAKETMRKKQGPSVLEFSVPFKIPYRELKTFHGRSNEIKEMEESLKSQKSKSPGTTARYCISGMGGMGKTQLAVKYAYQNHENYSAIFWIDVATQSDVNQSFLEAAERIIKIQASLIDKPTCKKEARSLGLDKFLDQGKFVLRGDRESDYDEVREAVLEWLVQEGNGEWLMILDNYDDDVEVSIDKCTPNPSINGSIIITTRLSRISHEKIIEGLDEKAATDLFLTIAGKEGKQDTELAQKVVHYIDYIPLAIEHAASYIRSSQICISEYIDLFQKYFNKLQVPINLIWRKYDKTILTVWKVTRDKIAKECPAAVDIFDLCSFLDPMNIKLSLFCSSDKVAKVKAEELDIRKWIDFLVSYSLVKYRKDDNGKSNSIEILRVVHSWARERMNDKEKVETIRRLAGHPLDLSRHGLDSRGAIDSDIFKHLTAFSTYFDLEITTKPDVFLGLIQEPGVRNVVDGMANAFQFRRLFDISLEWHERARDAKESLEDPAGKSSMVETLHNIGIIKAETKQYDEAEKIFRQVYEARKREFGEDHPSTLSVVNNLAAVCIGRNDYEEAEKLCKQALDGYKKHAEAGKYHPNALETINNMGLALDGQGKRDEALVYFQEACDAMAKQLGPEDPSTLNSMQNVALTLEEQNKYDDAFKVYLKVFEGRKKAFGEEHPTTIETTSRLSLVCYKLGRWKESRLYAEELRASYGANYQQGSPEDQLVHLINCRIAKTHIRLSEFGEAKKLFSQMSLKLDVPDYIGSCDGCAESLPFAWYICLECRDYELCKLCWDPPKSEDHLEHEFVYVTREFVESALYLNRKVQHGENGRCVPSRFFLLTVRKLWGNCVVRNKK